MRITAIDNYTLNGTEGLVCRYLGGHGPVRINAQSRQRAGLHPVIDSFSQGERTATLQVYAAAGANMHPYDLNELVHEIFHPPLGLRTLTLEYEGDTYTTECYVTSLEMPADTLTVRWLVQITIPSGLWHATDVTVVSDFSEPVEVTGNVPALPTLEVTGGDAVTRQRGTYTDRTGHGVSAYLVSVAPAVDDLNEENYIIYANGLQIPFTFEDGRLYFRIDCPPPPERTFVDIYQGASINNTVTAGRLDAAGTTLNAALSSGTVEADTDAAISNPLAPSLAWHPAITYRHEQRRPYVFGLDGNDIVLIDSDVARDQPGLPDDVDSYVIVTGSEAERIRNLNVTIEAGYQKSEQEASGGGSGGGVMRVIIKKFPDAVAPWVGAVSGWNAWSDEPLPPSGHFAQWTMGLTTFPTLHTSTMQGQTAGSDLEGNLAVAYHTAWTNHYPESAFAGLVSQYMGIPVTQGASGVYYLHFDAPPPDMPLMTMSVGQMRGEMTIERKYGTSETRYVAGNVPVIVFESAWVDPNTLQPLEENPETAGLLPDPVRGQARFVVKYRTRDSEHWITAYSRLVNGAYPSGTSVSLAGLNIATPDAVEIAIGLEPVSRKQSNADWGRLKITSTPTIDLVANKMPSANVSSAIEAQHTSRLIRNVTTGARIQLTDYLSDNGVEIDTSALTIRGAGGVGPVYGRLQTNKGAAMFQLMPGENDIDADNTELSWLERLAI